MTQAFAHILSTRVQHRVRTSMVRDDMLGYIVSGSKRLLRPGVSAQYKTGEFFLIARGTLWDMVNDTAPQGAYVAHVILLTPALIELFHEGFAQFSVLEPVQACAKIAQDTSLQEAYARAFESLRNPDISSALSQHRLLELLLMLAEQGLVFSPASGLSWADRVRRMVAQRPHDAWTVNQLATSFNLSASTLRRRLDSEGSTVSDCVREVRLETALLLLQTTMLPVSDIAYRSGYASHSRFSAAFRERFGFTPSHLRPAMNSGAQHLA
ncbi:helix-turn-helix transcriptional regulator [Undibacterium sp. Ren11W]|uniref:helix-turn-helix transcriptional regulator n=1 Tax=Undibacterium sp. Ren11W TaxID=3413045 RepID=UPI003BF4531B